MRYEEFKQVWMHVLRDSGLRVMHRDPTETLDLHSMSRKFETFVEPASGQDAEPFFVSASLSWEWDALQVARTHTIEEDLLTEFLGREDSHDVETEVPSLRIDISFNASLMHGKETPLPAPRVWENWAQEVVGRLERIERLLPKEVMDDTGDLPRVLAWQGEPSLDVRCSPEGELRLRAVKVHAWQAIHVPRVWDDPEREQDPDPEIELVAMFKRVRAALNGWMEAMDHLARPARQA
jgi:hypothetical protein